MNQIRTLHRWAALLMALPVVWIAVTGIVLHFRSYSPWLQPTMQVGVSPGAMPTIAIAQAFEAAKTVAGSGIQSWSDVGSIDVVAKKGVLRVRTKQGYEVHIDGSTGRVLNHGLRRVNQVFEAHEGELLGAWAPMWLFMPSGVLLLVAWITGVILGVKWLLKRR